MFENLVGKSRRVELTQEAPEHCAAEPGELPSNFFVHRHESHMRLSDLVL